MNDIEQGLAYHQAGRLDQAEAIYRQILETDPEQPEALHLLGLLAAQSGRAEQAVELINAAIRARPDRAEYYNNLGEVFRALHRHAEAIAAYEEAIRLKADYAEAYDNLGSALEEEGALDAAIAAFRQALSIKPRYARAHNSLGRTLQAKGDLTAAVNAYQNAVQLQPEFADSYNNLGVALQAQGKLEEAVSALQRACGLQPGNPLVHYNLGNAVCALGKLDDASAAYREALACDPDFALAHNNLGVVLNDQGKLQEALAALDRAVTLEPNYAEAHENRAWALLQMGDFDAGWAEYEWRFAAGKQRQPAQVLDLPQPRWNGCRFEGQSLLIHTEQGLGDSIQFIRYVPWVRARGGKVFLACPAQLHRLLDGFAGVDVLPAEAEQLQSLSVDLQVPLLSLPYIFQTKLDTIPNEIPYLRVPPTLLDAWRKRVDPNTYNIGFVWAGRPHHTETRNRYRRRSCNLHTFALLAQFPDVTFYSLQKDSQAAHTATSADGMHFIDYSSEFTDLAETAALIASLDLVISVDTAVAHLAGALGCPVWTLLPYAADWRWLTERKDTPWYPTMRLFRQASPGDWQGVMERVAAELPSLLQQRSTYR
jgi:tetratricopeptide (TPR) repeat protein